METLSAPSEKLVVLRMDGDFEHQGFRVTLEIGLDGHRPRVEEPGSLPAAPHLVTQLTEFKQLYGKLGGLTRDIRPQLVLRQETPRRQINRCRDCGHQLAESFLIWLNSDSFQPLDKRLREELNRQDRIRVLVRSQNPTIQQMPWHRWDFIDRYPHSEVVFGAISAETPAQGPLNPKQTVRILAIFGNGTGLNLDTDRQILASIPNAEITPLIEPSRADFRRALWDGTWDILFFAGHSQTDQSIGQLCLNSDERLSLEELTYGLREGVRKGLTLAIFNSCDGLGLAHALQQVNLPQIIVMRELVPDRLAHEFLQTFLTEFAGGHALHLAQRRAREQLEDWETKCPHASWLPVIVQNPAVGSLTWQQLLGREETEPTVTQSQPQERKPSKTLPTKPRLNWPLLKQILLVAVLATSFVVGIRSLGFLQISELKAYDHLTQLRPKSAADDRILTITVNEQDLAYQDGRGMIRKDDRSLSDQALAEIIKRLEPYKPRVIGLDIYHPHKFEPTLAPLIKQSNSLITICKMDSPNGTLNTMKPVPSMDMDHIGFSDLLADADGVIRRQLLIMTPGDICQTSQSFSLQVAEQYLQNLGIGPIKRLASGQQQLGNLTLRRFQHTSGGYQLPPEDANGYQILINYQYSSPQTISLKEFLENTDFSKTQLDSLNENFIVLIGVDQTWQDKHSTPLQKNKLPSVPGVTIHAYMISQLLDFALEQRGTLWWLSEWQETIWIFLWAIVGGVWNISFRSPLLLGLGVTVVLFSLFIACLLFLVGNGWVPMIPAALAILCTIVIENILTYQSRSGPRKHES